MSIFILLNHKMPSHKVYEACWKVENKLRRKYNNCEFNDNLMLIYTLTHTEAIHELTTYGGLNNQEAEICVQSWKNL